MATPVVTPALKDERAPSRAWVWILLLLVVAVYAPTAKWLWGRWTMSVWQHAHGLLIPPVVAYFVWLELRDRRHLPPDASAWGFLFVVPALALHALDTGLGTQLLSAISIVIAAPGLALLLLGAERTKAIAFPLAFLAFMLPIPLALTSQLHLFLRHIATRATAFLLPYVGVPVFAEGTSLHLANGTLHVADACSGFSTLYASLAVACLTAYSCRSWKRRLLVLATAVPIAIAANVVRMVLLGLMTYHWGFQTLDTPLHPASGMLTFVLALPVIFWLGQEPGHRQPKGTGPA
jgi:exosortase